MYEVCCYGCSRIQTTNSLQMLYNSWSNYFTTKNAKYTWTCIYHQAASWFNLLLTCIVYMNLPSHCYTILSHQWKRDNIMYNNLTVKKWAFPELYVQHSVHNYTALTQFSLVDWADSLFIVMPNANGRESLVDASS